MSDEKNSTGKLFVALLAVLFLSIVGGLGLLVWKVVRGEPPPNMSDNCKVDDECETGEVCANGECVPLYQPVKPLCQAGQSCDACSCKPPMSCSESKCQPSDASGDICASPKVQQALKKLVAECEKRGGVGLSCQESGWNNWVMNDAEFDELMARFPGGITIHFDVGRPPVDALKDSWPPRDVFAYYIAQLAKHRPALDAAKKIFLVGRASRGGTRELNQRLGFNRMTFVRELLRKIYTEPAERAELYPKLLNFTLGDARQLPADFFNENFSGRMTAWSEPSTDRLVTSVRDILGASPEDKRWTALTMNQVVILIPVPCSGKEVKSQ